MPTFRKAFTLDEIQKDPEQCRRLAYSEALHYAERLGSEILAMRIEDATFGEFGYKVLCFDLQDKPRIQPSPISNDNPPIWDLVIEDMRARDRKGFETYKTRLQAFNGRDALWDAYEETLDRAVYLRMAIYERDNPQEKYLDSPAYIRKGLEIKGRE